MICRAKTHREDSPKFGAKTHLYGAKTHLYGAKTHLCTFPLLFVAFYQTARHLSKLLNGCFKELCAGGSYAGPGAADMLMLAMRRGAGR